MKKRFFITFLFIILSIYFFIELEQILRSKEELNSKEYYYKENNPIDVFFVGTSRIYWPISPMEIWKKYGIATYNNGSNDQYYKLSYLIMEEILKTHRPKLIVFDIYHLTRTARYHNQVALVLNNLKNNSFKLYAYKSLYDNKTELLFNLNTINRFHSRWYELNRYDFTNDSFWKGQFSGSRKWDPHLFRHIKEYTNDNVTEVKLEKDSIEYAKKMVELVKKYDCEILFIKTPHETNDYYLGQDKSFNNLAEKNGWNFINYNLLYKELNIDFNNDFTDFHHMNYYGGRKVMNHLIPYIMEHYDIQSRKNDSRYNNWNKDYIEYERIMNKLLVHKLPDFNRWKTQAFYDNYTVMISSNGNIMHKLPDGLKSFLKSKGLTKYNTAKSNMKYVAIIDDNKVFYEKISENPVEYKGRMKRQVNLLVQSEGKSTINVSGKPISKNRYGLNIVLYDKINKEVVDSVWIDPNTPHVIRR